MIYEPGHPITTASDWEAFRAGFSPLRFAEVIDRAALNLPEWFVPLARGVAVPSDAVLRKVGCRPGSRRPAWWISDGPDLFRRRLGQYSLMVLRMGDFWMAGRWQSGKPDEVLVFPFASTPIFTRTYQAAMRLAQRCQWDMPQPFGYCWVTMRPANCEGAIALARDAEWMKLTPPEMRIQPYQ